jgi:hypothetical protein
MRHLVVCALRPLLFAACTLAITSTVSAEMLLAEISYTAPEPVLPPAQFGFGVGNSRLGPNPFHNWFESISAIPQTSYADAATISAMDRILTTSTSLYSVSFGLSNGPYEPMRTHPFELFLLDRAFEGYYADRDLTATRYVPPIGETYALQWYALTAIERTVTATVQTIRIYGFPAPEPGTWLLAVLGGLVHLSMSRSSLPLLGIPGIWLSPRQL